MDILRGTTPLRSEDRFVVAKCMLGPIRCMINYMPRVLEIIRREHPRGRDEYINSMLATRIGSVIYCFYCDFVRWSFELYS